MDTCYPDYSMEDLEKPSVEIRLVNGSNNREGFILVKKENRLGILCTTNYFVIDLVCQELGSQSGRLIRHGNYYGKCKCKIFYTVRKF